MVTLMLAHANQEIINKVDAYNKTPLLYALESNDGTILASLLNNHHTNLNQVIQQKTALLFALSSPSCTQRIIQQLLQYPININHVDQHGHGPLWHAIARNHQNVTEQLLKQYQSQNIIPLDLYQALHIAQNTDHYGKIVKYLGEILELDQAGFQEIQKIIRTKKYQLQKKQPKGIILTHHAQQRMEERNITYHEVESVIQQNHKKHTTNHQPNLFLINGQTSKDDPNICVVILKQNNNTIVITTYWNGQK